jgi:hypothetical protein
VGAGVRNGPNNVCTYEEMNKEKNNNSSRYNGKRRQEINLLQASKT